MAITAGEGRKLVQPEYLRALTFNAKINMCHWQVLYRDICVVVCLDKTGHVNPKHSSCAGFSVRVVLGENGSGKQVINRQD